MTRTVSIIATTCLVSISIGFAGKPWRPSIDQLSVDADLIVVGKVHALHPSLISDSENRRFAIAEMYSSETLKGKPQDVLRVAVETPLRYDEKGFPIPLSSAWRYELEPGNHEYLLFLCRPDSKGAVYFAPCHSGSGIVDLRPDHPNSLADATERVREVLRKIGEN